MPAVTVSTTEVRQIRVEMTISGLPMDETAARKLALDVQSDLKWKLGVAEADQIEVTLHADPSATPDPDPELESQEPKSDADKAAAIAAMTNNEYRAAKSAGTI